VLRLLLGEKIILWGASVQSREPGQVHPWHTDIETSRTDMRSVSVWIGIENTSCDSSLQLISGSHRLGCTVQEVVQQNGPRRGEASAQMIEAWAKEIDCSARLVKPDMTDGEGIIYDGRMWHGSKNSRPEGKRAAVLLQYAAADELISLPDLSQLEWPFRFQPEPPPVLMISGTAELREAAEDHDRQIIRYAKSSRSRPRHELFRNGRGTHGQQCSFAPHKNR